MKKDFAYNFLEIESNADDDLILKKIHFKRLKGPLPEKLVEFVMKKYLLTNDIRFFNELLWIVDKKYDKIDIAVKKFYKKFKNKKYLHNYSFKKTFLKKYQIRKKPKKSDFKNNSIALIGNPVHFILPFIKFKIFKINVDIINVIYYEKNKFFFNNILIRSFYFLIFGKHYHQIRAKSKDDLKSLRLPKKYDVGFHKLNFIIHDNIISYFKKGLINDHWGELPFLKGRSTLLYSKLFGLKPVITNHLIVKEIDSGKILLFTHLKSKFQRIEIIFGLFARIFESVRLLCLNEFINIDNKKGLMFYEMHPWLIKKIK